jgi:tetratricopeptide (TPR) repeat protein
MVGKLTAVLIRKEAEAYRSQGLHEEAFALYDELLSSTPNIDETLKSDIQSQMDNIAEEMEAFSSPKDSESLSSKEMRLLKRGWENGASLSDIMISAQGLCQIGAYQDALLEFGELLKGGIAPSSVISLAVECFLNLYDAKSLPVDVDQWLGGIYSEGKKVLAVHLLFIKELSQRSDKNYAFQYCYYIRSKPSLPDKLIKRLDAAIAKYKAAIDRMGKRPLREKRSETISRTIHNLENETKEETNSLDVEESEILEESEIDDDGEETDHPVLNELLAQQPQTLFRDDFPIETGKEKKTQRKFIQINVIGWFRRVFGFILPLKKRDKSLQL